jgi:hypothetical protein
MRAAACATRLAAVLVLLGFICLRLATRRLLRARPSSFSSPTRKEPAMTDLPSAPVDATAATAPAEAAPIATAPADPAPAVVDPNRVVGAVVQTVTSHPAIPQHKAAGVIASILGGLMQAEPAIFAVSRAGAQTQAEVSLGLGLAEVILGAFLHPAA